jgi:hypothetical protein
VSVVKVIAPAGKAHRRDAVTGRTRWRKENVCFIDSGLFAETALGIRIISNS